MRPRIGGGSSPGTNSGATSEAATRGNDTLFGRDSERTPGDVDPSDQDSDLDDPDIAAYVPLFYSGP